MNIAILQLCDLFSNLLKGRFSPNYFYVNGTLSLMAKWTPVNLAPYFKMIKKVILKSLYWYHDNGILIWSCRSMISLAARNPGKSSHFLFFWNDASHWPHWTTGFGDWLGLNCTVNMPTLLQKSRRLLPHIGTKHSEKVVKTPENRYLSSPNLAVTISKM